MTRVDEASKFKKHVVSLVWAHRDRQFHSAYESPSNMHEQKKHSMSQGKSSDKGSLIAFLCFAKETFWRSWGVAR